MKRKNVNLQPKIWPESDPPSQNRQAHMVSAIAKLLVNYAYGRLICSARLAT